MNNVSESRILASAGAEHQNSSHKRAIVLVWIVRYLLGAVGAGLAALLGSAGFCFALQPARTSIDASTIVNTTEISFFIFMSFH